MRTVILIFGLIVCAILGACCSVTTDTSKNADAASSQKAAHIAAPVFPALDAWLAENRLVINAGQSEAVEYDKAFAQGVVLAYGEGYPLAGTENAGQKRLTAITAAKVTAQRNMARYFAEYATDGEIRFGSYTARLEAFLKGAQVAVSEYNSGLGKAAVLLKLDLGGAKGFAR